MRMVFNEMPQHRNQLGDVLMVAVLPRRLDIVDDHALKPRLAVWRGAQILSHLHRGKLGHRVVLGNRRNLIPAQFAQRETVF